MTDLSWQDLLTLAFTTGAFTAVLNQTLGGWLEARRQQSDQEHQRALQEDERKHQARLRTEASHEKARDAFVEDAAGAFEWLRHEWGSQHGPDADWYSDNEPAPAISSVTDTIAALRRMELRHPTPQVRELARELGRKMSGHYGELRNVPIGRDDFEQVVGVTPDSDTFAGWVDDADALLKALHNAPPPAEEALAQ